MTLASSPEWDSASIEALEARIAALGARIERCRKAMILSRAAVWAGGALIVLAVVTVEMRGAVAVLLGLSAIIGGFTWLGANKSTKEEAEAALAAAEAQRAAMIDGLALREVGLSLRAP